MLTRASAMRCIASTQACCSLAFGPVRPPTVPRPHPKKSMDLPPGIGASARATSSSARSGVAHRRDSAGSSTRASDGWLSGSGSAASAAPDRGVDGALELRPVGGEVLAQLQVRVVRDDGDAVGRLERREEPPRLDPHPQQAEQARDLVIGLEEQDDDAPGRNVGRRGRAVGRGQGGEDRRIDLRRSRRQPVHRLEGDRLAVHLHEEIRGAEVRNGRPVGPGHVRVHDDTLDEGLLFDGAAPVDGLLRGGGERREPQEDDRDRALHGVAPTTTPRTPPRSSAITTTFIPGAGCERKRTRTKTSIGGTNSVLETPGSARTPTTSSAAVLMDLG